ncbi:uncharacterized protein LOC111245508 isoform X1 [Varroa destructor]|uniref:Uncharacterized protein n=1 Tax=Varroa destructor TaxID=109461 RepID=A0A7M7JBP6_VARDE|nr:uncharacterized protein LOC111245508 isoform X1 [Varroa destructor]
MKIFQRVLSAEQSAAPSSGSQSMGNDKLDLVGGIVDCFNVVNRRSTSSANLQGQSREDHLRQPIVDGNNANSCIIESYNKTGREAIWNTFGPSNPARADQVIRESTDYSTQLSNDDGSKAMVDPSPASETRSVSTQWVYQMNPSENNNGLFTWWYQMKGCGISNEPNVTSKHPQADGYVSYWHQGWESQMPADTQNYRGMFASHVDDQSANYGFFQSHLETTERLPAFKVLVQQAYNPNAMSSWGYDAACTGETNIHHRFSSESIYDDLKFPSQLYSYDETSYWCKPINVCCTRVSYLAGLN